MIGSPGFIGLTVYIDLLMCHIQGTASVEFGTHGVPGATPTVAEGWLSLERVKSYT